VSPSGATRQLSIQENVRRRSRGSQGRISTSDIYLSDRAAVTPDERAALSKREPLPSSLAF